MALDEESRANRFVGAMDGLARLFALQVPGMAINGDEAACLIALLADEAKILAHVMEPPRLLPAND